MPMRLSLVCHALTAAQRQGRFAAADEPLAPGQEAALAACAATLPAPRLLLCAPELRARQSAAAWPGEAYTVAALCDCDYATWQGRSLAEVPAQALADWLAHADSRVHGGESQAQLRARVGAWLDGLHGEGHCVAVSHPAVLRAALLHVLDGAAGAFNAIDVAPLTVLRLSHNGRWRLRL